MGRAESSGLSANLRPSKCKNFVNFIQEDSENHIIGKIMATISIILSVSGPYKHNLKTL